MSKYNIVEKEYEIYSDKINKDILISLISDIHYNKKKGTKVIDSILKCIDLNNPDFITIPGDVIDDSNLSDGEIFSVAGMIKEFSNIAPVIISLGNHDYMSKDNDGKWIYKANDILISAISSLDNVYLLDNKAVDFNKLGISFSGHTFPFNYYEKDKETIANYKNYLELIGFKDVQSIMNEDNFRCSLVHSPTNILRKEFIADNNIVLPVDLVLSGHMHGGVVPTLLEKFASHYGLVSPHLKPFPPYVRGLINCNDNTKAVVSTGVFKTGSDIINNLCEPEVNKVYIRVR